MVEVPRIAIGTIEPGTCLRPMVWALVEAFQRLGIQVQEFQSRACFPQYLGAVGAADLPIRHLDSWLMSPARCRALFVHGARSADLALVEGSFARTHTADLHGGRLEPLCEWLDLPRLVVLDAAGLHQCCLPVLPPAIDGLLLDGVEDDAHFGHLAVELESLYQVPVLGALAASGNLDAALARMVEGSRAPMSLGRWLGDQFCRWWSPTRILRIANRSPIPHPVCLCRETRPQPKITVAIAYDEAFNGYFPDTLDLLELLGANVTDFSPLRDEHLPTQADVVYIGCGHPERFAATLSENHCMAASLRSHLCAGRRIYAEGGGSAYLCQHIQMADGQWKRMLGILPARARLLPEPAPADPVDLTLARPTWLADAGTRLRGYRNPRWSFESLQDDACLARAGPHGHVLIGSFQAIGSLVHLDFAAHAACLDRFFKAAKPQPGFAGQSVLPIAPA